MATFELILLLLAAVLLSAVLDQIIPKVSSPLIQIALGLLIALFANDFITIDFDTNLFLILFIAPLLYDEARNTDKAALIRNIVPVLGLAIGLVLITTLLLGIFLNCLIPAIPLTAAFALAAALGPTDAVAVSSLPKDLDIGERRRNLLRGEYLLNDASGIVTFQFAIAATVSGAFNMGEASISFGVSFIGGLIIGCLGGFIANAISKYIRSTGLDNTTFHVMFDLFVPFIIFLLSEPIGASGIIAVVAGGLVRSFEQRAIGPNQSRLNIVSTSVWRTISFTLNGIVFVLLGTQLPRAMQSTWGSVTVGNDWVIICILLTTVVLLGIRFMWMVFQEYYFHLQNNRPFFSRKNFKSALLMTLAGPKGAVTLSIVLTIPILIDSTSFFPQRDLIIFISCGVILITLLMSNFVLPIVAPKTITDESTQNYNDNIVKSQAKVLRAVIEELTTLETRNNKQALRVVIREYAKRLDRIKSDSSFSTEINMNLRMEIVRLQEDYVKQLLADGDIEDSIAQKYLSHLRQIEERYNTKNLMSRVRIVLHKVFVALRTTAYTVIDRVPGATLQEDKEKLQLLKIDALQYAIQYMQNNISESKYKSEDISKLIFEYQNSIAILNSPAMRPTTIDSESILNLKRKALRIELDTINQFYDDGEITKDIAKLMRNNVTLMQVELEDDELSE